MSASGWRPPQWNQPQKWSVMVPGSTSNVSHQITDTSGSNIGGTAASGGTSQQSSSSTTYFFDAVLSSDHYTTRRFTDHPIQSGASVTAHSYQMPDRVILEVAFSDSMQSFQNGQYSSSVNAYQTFVTLQKSGQVFTLNTRLQNYSSMGIEDIRASDTNLTAFGARFTVVFKQVIIANLSTQVTSARPDQSQSTTGGTEQSTTVPQTTTDSHSTPGTPNPKWSSDPVGFGFATSGSSTSP